MSVGLKGKSDMISSVGIVLICVWDGGKETRGNENLWGSKVTKALRHVGDLDTKLTSPPAQGDECPGSVIFLGAPKMFIFFF